jgi:hypothetical protein
MFEHRSESLLPVEAFILRILRHGGIALAIVLLALVIGITGYRVTEEMHWVDALVNASMILGGMGPVNELHTTAGKIFAACYALFSGLVFLVVFGVLLAPLFHRFMHRFHLEDPGED